MSPVEDIQGQKFAQDGLRVLPVIPDDTTTNEDNVCVWHNDDDRVVDYAED